MCMYIFLTYTCLCRLCHILYNLEGVPEQILGLGPVPADSGGVGTCKPTWRWRCDGTSSSQPHSSRAYVGLPATCEQIPS